MKTCEQVRKLAHLYRPGECSAREWAVWMEHRRQCPGCEAMGRQLETLAQKIAALQSQGAEFKAPAGLAAKIAASLKRRVPQPAPAKHFLTGVWWRPRFRWAQALLLIALLSGFLWESIFSAAAIQERSVTKTLAAQAQSPVSPSLPALAFVMQKRACLDVLGKWFFEREETPRFAGRVADKKTLAQHARVRKEQHSQLAGMLQACGCSEMEVDYILNRNLDALRRYLSI